MDSKNISNLLRIGFTSGEAKVYLALLELGSSSVGPIVKNAGVAYSNIYEILERLAQKGAVTFITKQKTKYFQATNPSHLSDYLEKKEEEIQSQKNSLNMALPELLKLTHSHNTQDAEIFSGTKGLKTAYERLLLHPNPSKDDLFFYIHAKEYGERADQFYLTMGPTFKKIKGIRGIADFATKKSLLPKQMPYLNFRFVDFPIPGNMEVSDDKLLIVSWDGPIAILIKSAAIANTFRVYFESVWALAKK